MLQGFEDVNVWLGVLVVIVVFEAFTGGHVFMLYMFAPCLFTWLMTALFGVKYDVQLAFFIGTSILSILTTRRYIRKDLYKKENDNYLEEVKELLKENKK